ncbi:MAG: hypothetical protein A2033_19645 [Bacteroidetes bacterium GWA2_31_9]|nr:MAG: hypothetical protein A2033_19645 [Bacteroidetes bacterium GWA2_31_9]
MKKAFHNLAFLSLALSVLLISCGPSKKFLASEAKVENLQQDSINTHSKLKMCNSQVQNLNDEKQSLQFDKNSLQNENASVQNDLNALSVESKMTIEDQAKRLKNFQTMIQSQKDVMTKLKNSIADALMNYKTDELSIYIKDGNVYVSLEEKLLFKSGSDIVDPKGKEALKTLAKVLISTTDITVFIEGHTDNIPIKTTLFKDNWDLSTARATSILRILTKDNGFDSNRITAAGRGEFHPIKSNDTVDGRAANRRTEIILSPDLKGLYTLLYQ